MTDERKALANIENAITNYIDDRKGGSDREDEAKLLMMDLEYVKLLILKYEDV